MKRLLCIVGGMNRGGAETFLMKIYRQLDKTKYQMDFCVGFHKPGDYDEEIKKLGGEILYTTPKSKNPIASFYNIYKIVKTNNYDYVLRISQNSLSCLELLAARLAGAKNTIFRSSNTQSCGNKINGILHRLFKPLAYFVPTTHISPSKEAAKFMFGTLNKVTILNNGLDTKQFKFSFEKRNEIRKQFNAENNFIIGHIGRFNLQKNHKFLLEVFAEIKKQKENAVLWLIGKGKLETEIEKQAKKLNILDSIKFLGIRSDIPDLLSAMDVFVFPSLFEGMPNTVIEAQTNGLPCLIANTITKQAKQTEIVHFMSLKQTFSEWANKAIEIVEKQNLDTRIKYAEEMKRAGYNISIVTEQFVKIVFEENKK